MKNLFLNLVAIGSFQLLGAQSFTTFNGTDRFIEVKVADTMKVEADIIKVKIELPKDEEGYEFDSHYEEGRAYEVYESEADVAVVGKKERKQKGQSYPPAPPAPPVSSSEIVEESAGMVEMNQKEEVIEYLKSKNIAYKFHEPTGEDVNPFSKDFGTKENSFELVLNSPQQYESLKADLSKIHGVKVSVTSSETSQKAVYELGLIDKLMKKANAEAGVIAKAMGSQLDKPLNVTNISFDSMYSSMFNDPNSMGGMGALFSMMGNLFKSQDDATSVVVNKSIVVRFGIK